MLQYKTIRVRWHFDCVSVFERSMCLNDVRTEEVGDLPGCGRLAFGMCAKKCCCLLISCSI